MKKWKMHYKHVHFKGGNICTGCCMSWVTFSIFFPTLGTIERLEEEAITQEKQAGAKIR